MRPGYKSQRKHNWSRPDAVLGAHKYKLDVIRANLRARGEIFTTAKQGCAAVFQAILAQRPGDVDLVACMVAEWWVCRA